MKPSLKPAEYEIVQSVFKRLAQAPWFDWTSPNKGVRQGSACGLVLGISL
jgi:hypothetical protein